MDGDLTEVAPEILEMSRDPAVWRQQRAAAIRARILSQQAPSHSGSTPAPSAPAAPTAFPQAPSQSQAAVFAQLQAIKRRGRDEGPLDDHGVATRAEEPNPFERQRPAQPQPEMGAASPEGRFLPAALREKLMRAAAGAPSNP